jgi:hypothetical protein
MSLSIQVNNGRRIKCRCGIYVKEGEEYVEAHFGGSWRAMNTWSYKYHIDCFIEQFKEPISRLCDLVVSTK